MSPSELHDRANPAACTCRGRLGSSSIVGYVNPDGKGKGNWYDSGWEELPQDTTFGEAGLLVVVLLAIVWVFLTMIAA